MTSGEIRKRFLKFFESKKHKIVPSDSLVPANDPTLLFTSAGMNQFKEQFMGVNITFKRAATSQKCLRTGDLENVGRTAGHHTFFEMLGNFSFGDYFKEDAIKWAWEFMVGELELKPDRLWVSVYKDDKEAYDIWKNVVKIPESRIKRYGAHDNFWPADAPLKGPNGPCGPCSEIFYDQGEDVGCRTERCEPSCGCDRFVEVWNLVFTQFDRTGKNKLKPLRNKSIDTGMGLERLSAVMQGALNNFDTDLLKPIVDKVRKTGSAGKIGGDFRARAIADHARAVCFMIADGVFPSNEGRGYVERMLIRRAFRFGKELGAELPFLYKLVPTVAEAMKGQYPELETMRESIADVVLNEEKRFQNTLEDGTRVLESITEALKNKGKKTIPGPDAFKLYDTYGFPLQLTKELAESKGLSIDMRGFDAAMKKQKDTARSKSNIKDSIFEGSGEEDILKKLSKTLKPTGFLGYKKFESESTVLAVLRSGKRVKKAAAGEDVEIVLDKTPFYGETGGQSGDSGEILAGGSKVRIRDAKRVGDIIVHMGEVAKGGIKEKGRVKAVVDRASRLDTARNHTATHLLHYALREVLGKHVKQSGSLVAKDRLRFDFTHFKAVEKRELDRIEEMVNGLVMEDIKVATENLKQSEAKKKGAIALFGEKYGEKVRMVSVGGHSRELCGGTHLDRTGQIGLFRIISESSIASGARRIEALTGKAAHKSLKKDEDIITDVAFALKSSKRDVVRAAEETASRLKSMEKEIAGIKSGSAAVSADAILKDSKEVNGVKVVSKRLDKMDMNALRAAADSIKKKAGTSVIVLGSETNGKAALVCSVSKDLVEKGASADSIIKKISRVIGGSGGGRDDFAQAGGRDPGELDKALDAVADIVKECIKGKSQMNQ